jgi:predicted LPLAT superfamily acyltransferase
VETGRKIVARRRGNSAGFWSFRTALRLGGLRGAYELLYPVCLYYLLFDRAAVNGALAYIRLRFPRARGFRRWMHVYRLFLSQGRQLIDRHAALSGAVRFQFDLRGGDRQEALAHDARGCVLLTAHVGNWQIAMTTLGNMGKTVNLVMRPEDNPAVEKALSLCENTGHLKVISVEEDLGGGIEIINALKRGEIVSFMGDRPYKFKAAPVVFLGETAMFPCGPFQIAAAARCPLQILLAAREGHRRYVVDFKQLRSTERSAGVPDRGKIAPCMQEFADILEAFTAEHPYQCFLFADIWPTPPPASASQQHMTRSTPPLGSDPEAEDYRSSAERSTSTN